MTRISALSYICWMVAILVAMAACRDRSPEQEGKSVAPKEPLPAVVSFAEGTPSAIAGKPIRLTDSCNMESLDGKPMGADAVPVRNGTRFSLSGWGVDAATKQEIDEVYVRLESEDRKSNLYALASREPREDVANNRNHSRFLNSGDGLGGTLAGLAPGTRYQAVIVMIGPKGPVLCASGRWLLVQ